MKHGDTIDLLRNKVVVIKKKQVLNEDYVKARRRSSKETLVHSEPFGSCCVLPHFILIDFIRILF